MGFRTVVMLSNDMAHMWSEDPSLGSRIQQAMSYANSPERRDLANVGGYGRVVECCHADNQTLAMLDGYTRFTHLDSQCWIRGEADDAAAVRLLKTAARKMGYRLVKDAKAAA